MIISKKATRIEISAVSIAAILVIALLASIGMMQTNNAAAAGSTILKEKFRESFASADKTIQEGSITTTVSASVFKTTSGEIRVCLFMYKYDESTYFTDFFGCAPADQFTVANGLDSATFSGTITGYDFAAGEEKTVTVNVDLTATGKPDRYSRIYHEHSPNYNFKQNLQGIVSQASGSLNISGDLTFSTEDAAGQIAKVRSGYIEVQKL